MRGKIFVIGITAMLLLAGLASMVRADKEEDEEKPDWIDDEKEDKWILSNDQISIWFQGKKPMLKVFKTNEDGNVSGYKVKIKEIFEKDKSGEEVAEINLEAARPGDWTIAEENETNGLKVSMNALISQPGEEGGKADITLVFHINTTSAEVKFDLIVEGWEWKSQDGNNATLSLKMLIEGEEVEKEGEEEGEEESSVGAKGYIKWANKAVADGREINVTSDIGKEDEDETHITLTFENSGNCTILEYDPTIGISIGGISWIMIGGIVAAALIIAIVVVMVVKKRR